MPDGILLMLGLVALVAGAELLVRGGSRVATTLGIAPIVVGVTVVSIGTSTPELAVGVEAAVQGNGSLAVGTIAGTNVVNLLLILGLSAALRPLTLHAQTLRLDLPIVVAVALLCLPVFRTGQRVSRLEGGAFVALYVVYVSYLLLART